MAKMQVMSLENLTQYDGLIKNYIDTADAKSLKTVAIDGNTLKFYKVEEPVGTTEPVYEITLPETDISGLMAKLTDATVDNIVTVAENGEVKDSGVAIDSLATDEELKAVSDLVGVIPDGYEATTIAEYAKELADNVAANGYDDTELAGKVTANTEAIEELDGEVGDLTTLKTTEKTTVVGAINEVSDAVVAHKTAIDETVTTLVGEDTGKSVRTIANEELAKQLIPENASESLDTLEEIAAWIQSHPDDASAMNKAIEDLEALVGTLPEGITATTVVGYVQELVNTEKSRAEGIESGLDTRITALEGVTGEGYEPISSEAIANLFA